MRIKRDTDCSILNDMNTILSSEEYISLMSPIQKKAQEVPDRSLPERNLSGPNQNARGTADLNNNIYAPNVNNQQSNTSIKPEEVKAVLNEIMSPATFANQQTKAMAHNVLLGNISNIDQAVKMLLPFFKGKDAASVKSALQGFSNKQPVAVASVIPVVVKVANVLNDMGFEMSELVADKLLQTITVEAKAKAKAKLEKECKPAKGKKNNSEKDNSEKDNSEKNKKSNYFIKKKLL